MTFANRTPERAQQLADRFLGRAIALNDLASAARHARHRRELTASPLPIIGKGLTESALKARKHRPMLMLDLAVPRDVEGEVGRLDDVFLYTVDDLGRIARAGMDSRQNAVAQAEVIIENQVTDFMHWLGNRELVPTITRAARLGRARAPARAGAGGEAPGARATIRRSSWTSSRTRSLTSSCTRPPTRSRTRARTTARRSRRCSRASTRCALPNEARPLQPGSPSWPTGSRRSRVSSARRTPRPISTSTGS